MSRGEDTTTRRGRFIPAQIVDENNKVHYHVVSSWHGNLVVIFFVVVLLAMITLMVFMYQNKTAIDVIEKQISVPEENQH